MDTTSAAISQPKPTLVQRPNALLPIVVGGLTAGALDATTALITYGWGMPRAIAGGLLGPTAFQGGTGTWILGLLLHFFITVCAAAAYWLASRKLGFLK